MQIDEYRKMFTLEENFWWYRGMLRITQEILGNCLDTPRNLRILDAGCGTGKMLLELKRYTLLQPVGLDFSGEALKFLKLRGLSKVLQASTSQIPFKPESFDLVTSFEVLCQLPGEGDVQALREFHRVLGPRGKILVRLPAYPWMYATHDRCVLTFHRYHQRELIDKVHDAGFRILRTSYVNCFLFPLLAFKRLVLEKFGILVDSSDVRPVPGPLNSLLEIPLRIESHLLRYETFRFPYGLSILCLAEKR